MSQAERLVEAVIGEMVLPVLAELDMEARQSIAVKVSVVVLGDTVAREVCTRTTESENGARGEVRVVVRESAVPNRFIFSAQPIIEGFSPGTGFSGFSLGGELKFSDAQLSAKLTARTNQYNVWSWRKGFAFP